MTIRRIKASDEDDYLRMAKALYDSDAVLHPVGTDHFIRTFEELMRSDTYALCYILETGADVLGYCLLSRTFSQEAGGPVIWIEEIYIKDIYRGQGLGSLVLDFIEKEHSSANRRMRLEVEPENAAVRLYEKMGFRPLPYRQMYKSFPDATQGTARPFPTHNEQKAH